MGGRLSSPIENEIQCFPHHNWQEEFRLAQQVGFNSIDWIVDGYEQNPIFNDKLILQMQDLSQKFNVKINTICADYFLFQKIFNEKDENIEKNMDFLKRLIRQAKKFGVEIIEIPFVDNSSLKTDNDKNELIENLQGISPLIKENGIKIALETDLPPRELKKFVEEIDNSTNDIDTQDSKNNFVNKNSYDPKDVNDKILSNSMDIFKYLLKISKKI